MIKNINVRFFTYCTNEELEIDKCEISESQFKDIQLNRYGNDFPVTYERHTMRENGVNQICLTIHPVDPPHIGNLEGA